LIRECRSEDDFRQTVANSNEKAVLLFKHSTACALSREAREIFSVFAEQETRAEFWQVLVMEKKELSRWIATETGIKHKSPQVILLFGGKAIWDCSHHSITGKKLNRQLDSLGLLREINLQ
jgi:bacillithiol system protein YtxJ